MDHGLPIKADGQMLPLGIALNRYHRLVSLSRYDIHLTQTQLALVEMFRLILGVATSCHQLTYSQQLYHWVNLGVQYLRMLVCKDPRACAME